MIVYVLFRLFISCTPFLLHNITSISDKNVDFLLVACGCFFLGVLLWMDFKRVRFTNRKTRLTLKKNYVQCIKKHWLLAVFIGLSCFWCLKKNIPTLYAMGVLFHIEFIYSLLYDMGVTHNLKTKMINKEHTLHKFNPMTLLV